MIAGIVFDASSLRPAIHRRNRDRGLVVAPWSRDGATGIALAGAL